MSCDNMNRKGSVAAMLAVLMLPLLALLALFVDYGFLLYVRTDLQRTADQVALAGVRDLVPDADGNQDTAAVRDRILEYIEQNMGENFSLRDADVEIGRYDPETIYDSVDILDSGTFDTVRITIRRDDLANSSVALYFARLFDRDQSDVSATATAVLQRARYLGPGTSVFPVAVSKDLWDSLDDGDEINIYGDGKVEDGLGDEIPGNFGTVDIGPDSNGTSELNDQIVNGLLQGDLDALASDGIIPDSNHIDSQQVPLVLNADPGFSSGIKHGVGAVNGELKLLPIYNGTLGTSSGGGNNLKYKIVGWGLVEIVDAHWRGNKGSSIQIQRMQYAYDGKMIPNRDLSDFSDAIEGVFTSPVLVE